MKQSKILIVDDEPGNIDALRVILRTDYELQVATDGEVALDLVAGNPPDLILLDVMMPKLDGYKTCKALKANPKTKHIPIIFVTSKRELQNEYVGLKIGAVDYIIKPVDPMLLIARVTTHLALYHQRLACEKKVRERTTFLETARIEVVERLGVAASWRDDETGEHIQRISLYAVALARKLGWCEKSCERLLRAAPMHDIGKIGIPDGILYKPNKLSPKEWVVMKTHAEIGAMILGKGASPLMEMSRAIAYSHHEKWDGSGYPKQLKETDIPLAARIVAIADVFDALTTERPYKKAWSVDKAFDLIAQESGQHFDPELAMLFLGIKDEVLRIWEQFQEK